MGIYGNLWEFMGNYGIFSWDFFYFQRRFSKTIFMIFDWFSIDFPIRNWRFLGSKLVFRGGNRATCWPKHLQLSTSWVFGQTVGVSENGVSPHGYFHTEMIKITGFSGQTSECHLDHVQARWTSLLSVDFRYFLKTPDFPKHPDQSYYRTK